MAERTLTPKKDGLQEAAQKATKGAAQDEVDDEAKVDNDDKREDEETHSCED